jgi:glycosyltransferase involved in cell wall biosynthesis
LSRAHIILVQAVRERWGRVVIEANAMGTPAIGYDVPGLRDSIRHGETGITIGKNSHSDGTAGNCLEILIIFPIIVEMHLNALDNLAGIIP